MPSILVQDLIPVLQIAVGPVILISGIGLLLLSMTNRYGRAIDRSRQLVGEKRQLPEPARARVQSQIDILYRRAQLIRLSITMAAVSILLAAVLILLLFLIALLKWEAALLIVLLFSACLLALIISMVAFIRDIQLSLKALKLEIGEPQGAD